MCMCVLTQTVWTVYGKAHEDDVSVRIGQGAEPIIVFLSSCVPQSQFHLKETQTHTHLNFCFKQLTKI